MTASRASSPLLAGAAVADITPSGSVFLYGYPHVPRMSTGIHDPLECAALYLKRGDGQVLFLANDVICFTRDFVRDVRRRIREATGIPEGAILISATHTHSGPVITNHLSNAADKILPKADPSYLRSVAGKMVEAAQRAVQGAVPAEIGLSLARAEGVGTNRHDPTGPSDPQVPVLIARSVENHIPLACLLVYGMHPTVLHEDSTLISADFPYFTRAYLRQTALPANCPILYHNGSSGNQSPRHVTRANTFAEAQRLGELLGKAIAAVIAGTAFLSSPRIHHKNRSVALLPRRFPSVEEADRMVAEKRATFERLKKEGAPRQAVRTAECDVFGAEETAELSLGVADGRMAEAIAKSSPAEVQMIEIGPWRFVAWPGEYFVEYCLELKSKLANTFLITIANGELQGYIVTAEAAANRVYESANAIFAPTNGRLMIEATLALAQE